MHIVIGIVVALGVLVLLSSSVLITSSTPNRWRSHTGTATQAAPTNTAAARTAGTAMAGMRPATCSPTQVAAIAPA